MRTVKINDELSVEISALNRGQLKKLRAQGFKVSTLSPSNIDVDQWDDFIDAVVKAYSPSKAKAIISALDDLGRDEYKRVCLEFIAETWGKEDEEEN